MKLPGPVWVEIYQTKVGPPGEWRARRPGTKFDFPRITPQSTPATLQRQIEALHFETRLTEWEAFDATVSSWTRLLKAGEWKTDKHGHPYLSEKYLEDRQMEKRKNLEIK